VVSCPISLLAVILLITPRKKKWFAPFLIGSLLVASTQLLWIKELRKALPDSGYFQLLAIPSVRIGLGILGTVLILVALIRLFSSHDSVLDLGRQLERRGDHQGAARVMLDGGHTRQALRLFGKAQDWEGAAEASSRLGRTEDAARFYRKCGGESLSRAHRLFQQAGNSEEAQQCLRDYGKWLRSSGRLDEAIEVWVRSSDYERACRIVELTLKKGRLQPSLPAFSAAKRAAAETRNHKLLGALCELEGSWPDAGRYWSIAGDFHRAAAAFARAGRYTEAAELELKASQPDMAANYLLERLNKLRSQYFDLAGLSGEKSEKREFQKLTGKLVPLLKQLGRTKDLVDVLSVAGRSDEAINHLLENGMADVAAEVAVRAERWEMAGLIFEDLKRWGEAAEVYERAEQVAKAAQCSELAGDDQNAMELWKRLGRPVEAAHCLARIGSLEDGLKELHQNGLPEEACQLLKSHPGPVPDIPEIILDMAEYQVQRGHPGVAIGILQRAVLGVALQEHRLGPALALVDGLLKLGEIDKAQAQVDRILAFSFSNEQAQMLKRKIIQHRKGPSATVPAQVEVSAPEETEFAQRYEIQHELGSGGMGVVFLARDRKLDRDVAIKVLRTTSEEEAQRLKNEAMVAATLNHPGIVTIFDFEAGFDGYFIAMEYVPGETLAKLIKDDLQRVQRQLSSILIQIAESLIVAHDRQIIHRDLKPANILLTEDNRVKLLDFGIAARLDKDSGSGGICGTPYYMAPEQIRGDTPSPATDIYSLGTTAYHLATGHPPFRRGNVIQAQLEERPADPCEENPDLPRGLADIILHCLEKDPAERFADSRELAEALRALG